MAVCTMARALQAALLRASGQAGAFRARAHRLAADTAQQAQIALK
jgi:hypothetical protein